LIKNLKIVIPAFKKNVVFPDDIIKKINGKTLIERAIDLAISVCDNKDPIHVITDSEEITLISERKNIHCYLSPKLAWGSAILEGESLNYLESNCDQNQIILFLSPYSPMLTVEILHEAISFMEKGNIDFVKPIKVKSIGLYNKEESDLLDSLFNSQKTSQILESKSFLITKISHLKNFNKKDLHIKTIEIANDLVEIHSLHDWWICEKFLKRKTIVFRVIGDTEVGMGHIYRALSLAHEISDHQIMFVCDSDNRVAVNNLAGSDYWLGIYEPNKIVEKIISLKPHLVINDILTTNKTDIIAMQNQGIKVVNFEDLGEGAQISDITFNELYDQPLIEGANIRWGQEYFFVRDEFNNATPHPQCDDINNLLITFGGTDPNDSTFSILEAIFPLCEQMNIHIDVVTGSGYNGYDHLKDQFGNKKNISITRATGVISKIMERTQFAITSNGRTIYELAHMNIPSIVIPHHEREKTHLFACRENGFLVLDTYKKGISEKQTLDLLQNLLSDLNLRKELYTNISRYSFTTNKFKVIKDILSLIEEH
jgi:spore coat polysaccharide biosynthesis predicted glycosyltransferase SpsG/CMP-N-acetylneuraminic acid synthetase